METIRLTNAIVRLHEEVVEFRVEQAKQSRSIEASLQTWNQIQFKAAGDTYEIDGGFEWFQSTPAKASRMLDRLDTLQQRTREANERTGLLLTELEELLGSGAVPTSSATGREYGDAESVLDHLEQVYQGGPDRTFEEARRWHEIADHDNGENPRDRKDHQPTSRGRESEGFEL